MNIGLFFGTFNPIHIGHLIIANHFVEFTNLEQIWLVVTPHNPLKEKTNLLDDYQRLHLVHLATEDYPKIKPSDVEFKLLQPNYTINTLMHLQEKFPKHQFSLLIGEDNLNSIHKWKNYKIILENYEIYVYPRINEKRIEEKNTFKNSPKIHYIQAPIIEISATYIRDCIKKKKNYRALLPQKVWDYIDHNNLYKK